MTLRKNDIELINRISAGQVEGLNPGKEDVILIEKILDHSASWVVDSERSEVDAFNNILGRIEKNDGAPRKVNRVLFKIAAAVTLLILSTFSIYTLINQKTAEAELTEIKTVYLPDGSMVVLNASSHIAYDDSDWKEGNRSLELQGQAYFEVKKGSMFSVKSNHGIVSVLGTSFNIYDRGKDFKVECFTGKVKVESVEHQEEVYLTKGLKTELNIEKSVKLKEPEQFDEEKGIEWISGVFNFYNAPLHEVFSELERQYDIDIEYTATTDKFYTGTFNKFDLEKAITSICKPMGYRHEIKDNDLIIYNN